MDIQISLKSHAENQADHLVAMLRSMDFVENVKIHSDVSKNTVKTNQNRFDKYNGVWKNKLKIEEIDEQLNILRSEWERNF